VLAAQALGADLAYIGSAFIATPEANATETYKTAIVSSAAEDIVYTDYFTGVRGNYLRESIIAAGLDPANIPESDPSKLSFAEAPSTGAAGGAAKAWRDIWGAGQGVGAVKAVLTAGALVDRLEAEYLDAGRRLLG